jgi:hypothetical protein
MKITHFIIILTTTLNGYFLKYLGILRLTIKIEMNI